MYIDLDPSALHFTWWFSSVEGMNTTWGECSLAWHRSGTVTGYTDTHTGGDQVRVLKDINIKKYWGGRKGTLKVADPGPHNLRSTSSSSSVSIHLSDVSGEDYTKNIQKRRDCQSNCVNHGEKDVRPHQQYISETDIYIYKQRCHLPRIEVPVPPRSLSP